MDGKVLNGVAPIFKTVFGTIVRVLFMTRFNLLLVPWSCPSATRVRLEYAKHKEKEEREHSNL